MAIGKDELIAKLEALGLDVPTLSHPPLFTVADSQALRGEIAGAHTKNLFLKDRKDNYFLLVVAEDAIVDLKTVHNLIGAAGKVSFGKPEAMLDLLGVTPGAVTIFGAVNDHEKRVAIFLDADLMEADIINAHPLTNEATSSIRKQDLLHFLEAIGHEPTILKVTQ